MCNNVCTLPKHCSSNLSIFDPVDHTEELKSAHPDPLAGAGE